MMINAGEHQDDNDDNVHKTNAHVWVSLCVHNVYA